MNKEELYSKLFIFAIFLIIIFVIFGFLKTNTDLSYNGKNNIQKQIFADYNDHVWVYYKLTVDGKVIDDSFDRNELLDFTIGSNEVIKGFSDGVLGMTIGETRTFIVDPKDGYGDANTFYEVKQPLEYIKNYVKTITKKEIPEDKLLGIKLFTQNDVCIIDSIKENIVYLKCQNKLAGKELKFKVKLVKIEKKK